MHKSLLNIKLHFAALIFTTVMALYHATAIANSSAVSKAVSVLDVDGYKLEYIDIGSGEPVVFVHGAIADYRTWGAYQQRISESARYISYSRRNYGQQDWPQPEPVSDDQIRHAKDLAQLIESLNAGPAHLVSWSNSGKTIAVLGATRPELIKSITQYEPVLSDEIMDGINEAIEPGKKFASGWGAVAQSLKSGDQDTAVRLFIEHVFEMQPGGFSDMPAENQQVAFDNGRTIPLLFNDVTNGLYSCDYVGKTIAPTVVVVGDKTNDWWQLMSEKIASCHADGELVTMSGANHSGPITNVDTFSKIILDQVEKY